MQMICNHNGFDSKVLKNANEAVQQILQILTRMGFSEERAIIPCKEWITRLGTPSEQPVDRQRWATLTFIMGLGLEHFGIRAEARKLWLSGNKMSKVATSAGIPEAPQSDPLYPCWIMSEVQESEWQSKCRGVTAAGAIATFLGAARQLTYNARNRSGCAYMDGWAPVQLPEQTARCLGILKAILRLCMLRLSEKPALLENDVMINAFSEVLMMVIDPRSVDAGQMESNNTVNTGFNNFASFRA